MCAKYSSAKLLNIVTWDEWHTLVPRADDENEYDQGNEQDDDNEEEQRRDQDDNDEEERWSK